MTFVDIMILNSRMHFTERGCDDIERRTRIMEQEKQKVKQSEVDKGVVNGNIRRGFFGER